MSDHPDDHEHSLSCLALDDLSQALATIVEEGLSKPIGYVFHFLDPSNGMVQCATNLPEPVFKEFMAAATEELSLGRVVRMAGSGETVQ